MTTLDDYRPRAVGIPWFREEDYPAVQAIFKATNYLPPWKEWLERAESLENDFKAKGYIVERVYIDPDTFPHWCREHGIRIDAQARMDFTTQIVAEKYRGNQS